jgi:ribosomal protein S14
MAKKSLVVRNNLRFKMIQKDRQKLSEIRQKLRQSTDLLETFRMHTECRKLRNSMPGRYVKRCAKTGRARCVFKTGLSRHAVKYLLSKGSVPGTYKI